MPMVPVDFDGSLAEVRRSKARSLARVPVESDYEPDPFSRSEITQPSIPLGNFRVGRYNEIQVARYNRYLQKLLSMKGEVPAPQLASEITPMLALFHGQENFYLQGWELFGVSVFAAGGAAGTLAKTRIRNPAGSNVVAVFQKINISLDTADFVNLQHATTSVQLAGGVVLTGAALDNRTRPTPSMLMTTETAALGNLTALGAVRLNSNVPYDFVQGTLQEIPLLPGDALQAAAQNAGTGIMSSWLWRERFLEESERA